MQVVYIDVLFLVNFCMDFLALWFSGGFLRLPRKKLPLVLASVLGAVYAIGTLLWAGHPLVSMLIGAAMAFLLCYVAYGRECRRRLFVTLSAVFYVISCLFGGMITAFYSLLERFFRDRRAFYEALAGGEGKIALFFSLMLIVTLVAGGFKRFFLPRTVERTAKVDVRVGKERVMLSALVDTGNTLCDPLSGRACIVIDPDAVHGVVPSDVLAFSDGGRLDTALLSEESGRRIRLIPTESVGGDRLLVGFLPDRIEVTASDGKGRRAVEAILVIDEDGGGFNGHAALLPPVLIR